MAFDDMRAFLQHLRECGQLREIDVPLKAMRGDNELQALMRYLAETEGPALILNNLEGINRPDIPVIFNPFGTRERTAMTIGLRDPLETKIRHAEVLADTSQWIDPVIVERHEALCKDVVIEEHDVALDKQLPHVWLGEEGSSFICGGVVTTKDPETGERNVGWYRLTQFWNAKHGTGGDYSDERQKKWLSIFAFWNPPMSHIGIHLAKAQAMGQPLEIAIACQCDPAVHVAACTSVPFGQDEYAYAGGLREKAVELVKCDTVDLEVPATAEFVIEGVFHPNVEQEVIGWHSNTVGYYDKVQIFPVFEVKRITHRKNPLWYATIEMMPPFDHNYLAMIPIEGELLADLQSKIPEVRDVVVTPNLTYIVQLALDGANKPHAEFGKYVLHAVWGASGRWGRTAKWVIVVGPDVNPYDLGSVEWALQTRVQPYSDTVINKTGQAMVLDPSCTKGEQGFAVVGEQIGIDATIKVPERFDDYAPVSQASADEVKKIGEKLKEALS